MQKIMVVDDDEQATTMLREFLTMEGYESIVVNESATSIEVASAKNPDLFVLDLMMPEPDGFKLCRILRNDPIFKRTPIIILTALDETDSKIVAFGAGANDYLTKPYHIEDFKSRISALLEKAE